MPIYIIHYLMITTTIKEQQSPGRREGLVFIFQLDQISFEKNPAFPFLSFFWSV